MSDALRFWMVAGDGPTAVRHKTRRLAEQEAMRLARACPGTRFYVMEAVSTHRKVEVESVILRGWPDEQGGDDGIPF